MIGVFGGTFDPIHFGHLRCAWEIAEQLELREVRMIPCRVPPHRRQPLAAAEHRAALMEIALAGQTLLRMDRRELDREGVSYMVDTLRSLRAEVGAEPLCLILGQDAFNGLPGWHRWETLPELAHLVVITRPGSAQPEAGPLAGLIEQRTVEGLDELVAKPAGTILFRAVTPLGFSASRIRDMVASGHSPRYLLPDRVLDYIQQQGLYLNLN